MTRVGLIQTRSYENNNKGIQNISNLLKKLGDAQTEIVCLPEQWLPNNEIKDYDQEFLEFKKIAKDHSMTIIPEGHFMKKTVTKYQLIHQLSVQKMRLLENKKKSIHLTMKKTQ